MRIAPFDGSEDGWKMWSGKFMAWSSMRDYDEILEGDTVVPDVKPRDDAHKDELAVYSKLLERNKHAFNQLILCMQDEVCYGIVLNSKPDHLPKGDARMAWLALLEKFEPNDGAAMVELKQKFNTSKLENTTDDPEIWINQLEQIRRRLKGLGHAITDLDLALHLLTNLPETYETTIELAERDMKKNGNIDIKELRSSIRSRFKKLQKNKTEKDTVLFNNEWSPPKCSHCNKSGHKSDDCFSLTKNKGKLDDLRNRRSQGGRFGNGGRNSGRGNGGGRGNNNGERKCYKCGKPGHIKANCPEKEEAGNNTQELVFMTNEVEKPMNSNVWVADCAATCHMGFERKNLSNYTPSDSEGITMGDGSSTDIKGRGTFSGTINQNGKSTPITLRNYAWAPNLKHNLFSIQVAMQAGFKMEGDNKKGITLRKGSLSIFFRKKIKQESSYLLYCEIHPGQEKCNAHVNNNKK